MSTLYGVNRTLTNYGPTGQYILGAGLFGGKVSVMADHYAMASMTGTSNVLYLGDKIPQGSKILAIMLSVTANQTSLTFKLGTAYNDDEFVSAGATALQTAGTYWYAGKEYEVGTAASDDQIILTNAAAAGTSATLYCLIIYANN